MEDPVRWRRFERSDRLHTMGVIFIAFVAVVLLGLVIWSLVTLLGQGSTIEAGQKTSHTELINQGKEITQLKAVVKGQKKEIKNQSIEIGQLKTVQADAGAAVPALTAGQQTLLNYLGVLCDRTGGPCSGNLIVMPTMPTTATTAPPAQHSGTTGSHPTSTTAPAPTTTTTQPGKHHGKPAGKGKPSVSSR